MSLHASELNPVIATLCPRTLVLKFAIVRELETFLIFFVLSQMYNRMATIVKCTCTMP